MSKFILFNDSIINVENINRIEKTLMNEDKCEIVNNEHVFKTVRVPAIKLIFNDNSNEKLETFDHIHEMNRRFEKLLEELNH